MEDLGAWGRDLTQDGMGVTAGSKAEAIQRRHDRPGKVGLKAEGRVVWEGQEDKKSRSQLRGLAATWAQEIRAQAGMVQKRERKQPRK